MCLISEFICFMMYLLFSCLSGILLSVLQFKSIIIYSILFLQSPFLLPLNITGTITILIFIGRDAFQYLNIKHLWLLYLWHISWLLVPLLLMFDPKRHKLSTAWVSSLSILKRVIVHYFISLYFILVPFFQISSLTFITRTCRFFAFSTIETILIIK